MKKDLENLDKYLLDAIENINNDRAVTKMLLLDVIELIKKTKENHKKASDIHRNSLKIKQGKIKIKENQRNS